MNADQTFRLILIAGSLTLLAVRTRIQEAQLLARFGGAYEACMHRMRRFLPRR
jgi:protein-S-isoprenylcysteine O-methyltransferase Ste14